MKLERRAYETRAVENIIAALIKNSRVLAVGPTGCGKTVIASMVIKRMRSSRVLFVAHKYELIDQARERLAAHGITAGVIMAQDERLHGNERTDHDARVQVASVQTVSRRGGPDRVDLIVFDEAHRAMAASYQQVASAYPNARVLGLTATPCRMDGKGLGDFFQEMVSIAKPSELYEAGYLARPRVFVAPAEVVVELTKRTKGEVMSDGDYSGKALARIVDSGTLVGKVVSEAIRLAPNVPKVVFAGSVKHSQALAAKFKRRGIKADHLDGDTEPAERERILSDLRSGNIEVVCNVDVLTEGWDLPSLGAVILARPTRSITKLLQMTGRVQRPHKGRQPVVIDHGNCCIALGVDPREDIPWSLDGAESSDRPGDEVVKSCADCLAVIPGGCTECPSCGSDQPKTRRQERDEMDAKLVELEASRLAEMRARVERVAQAKNAPIGWVDKVIAEMRA
jgi:DNA repair protein RadD